MKIIKLKTNRIKNPLGFSIDKPRLSFVVTDTEAKKQTAVQIEVSLDNSFSSIIFDSGKNEEINSLSYELPIQLSARTRYYWRVHVWADNGEYAVSEPAWFETAKIDEEWAGKWIAADLHNTIQPVLFKSFTLQGPIATARAYICGLGLYEMNINESKAGDEYLTPHFNAYDKWLQYQTYDITHLVQEGSNLVEVSLANGWYKGRFGIRGGSENIYGDQFSMLCEIVVSFKDGSSIVIPSDNTWQAKKSKVVDSNIYDGELYDSTLDDTEYYRVLESDMGYERLKARLSLPVKIKEEIKPIELIETPSGEKVLDMGQNMVGWLKFSTNAPKETTIRIQHGEVLQDGSFFNENLQSAKAEFTYIADGTEAIVHPRFTFYGFRYAKIEGWLGEIDLNDFTGCVVYSDMEQIGHIETSNKYVNRLFLNALWGQKGNFVDTPTDCPQRDERLGWTGDAQVFSGTACFNMDAYAFFNKFVYDLSREQEDKNGMVPLVVPAVNFPPGTSSAWGDVATIVPWNMYVHYGDKTILEQQFESMKGWVDYIRKCDEESGGNRLWSTGIQLGDWLSLDSSEQNSLMGGTDREFIASTYYCYSAKLVSKAAEVLGYTELASEYKKLTNEITRAIQEEFFTNNGRLAINTQTAYTLALFMDLIPDGHEERIANDLRKRLELDNNHLKTGFVGTPYLNRVLSRNGSNDLAYTLLLNDDYPSWLYSVKLGATTIWERWNSILPNGEISGSRMNSLNHYAYGAVVEWMYRNVAGLNPTEDAPGFRHVILAPQPDIRLKWAKANLHSVSGQYVSEWCFDSKGNLSFSFVIPFNATATAQLPHANLEEVVINGRKLSEVDLESRQVGKETYIELHSGKWKIHYKPNKNYIESL